MQRKCQRAIYELYEKKLTFRFIFKIEYKD